MDGKYFNYNRTSLNVEILFLLNVKFYDFVGDSHDIKRYKIVETPDTLINDELLFGNIGEFTQFPKIKDDGAVLKHEFSVTGNRFRAIRTARFINRHNTL